MSSVILLEEPISQVLQPGNTLDETVWMSWLNRNTAHERRNRALRMEVAKWSCTALLVFAAGLALQRAFVYPLLFTKMFQFAVTAGAIAFAWETIHLRRYVLPLVFIAVALLFNPLLSNLWLFRSAPLLFLSALPFVLGSQLMTHRVQTAANSSEVCRGE